MSYHVIRPKDRDAWLEERKKGLGSSDAGTIMGVSPFSTPLKLWRQKTGLDAPTPESEAMRNGHYLEPAVAEYFAAATNSVIDKSSEGDWLAVDDKKPWLRVSPDRLFWPEGAPQTPENRYILEIKSTSKIVDPDNLPLYWICQVQYQMGVMGVPLAAIAWVTGQPRLSMGHTWIQFNPNFFNTLVTALDTFWNENILKNIAPEPLTGDDIKLIYPFSEKDKYAAASAEDVDNCKVYIELEEEIENLTERLDKVGTAIKNKMAEAESLIWTDPDTGENTTVARYKSINETVFDEEKMMNEDPVEYNKYLRQCFDKKLLKDEDAALFKKYSSTRKGTRRFSICIK